MPKHSLVVPFAQFRGAIKNILGSTGLVLYDSPKAGNVSRSYVVPTNNSTTHQVLMRGYLTQAANGFQALSTVNADLWNTAAAEVNRTDALGVGYKLTGIGLYAMINCYRLMNGQILTSDVPALDSIAAADSITSATVGGGNLTVVAACASIPDTEWCYVRITDDLGSNARRARRNELRFITTDFDGSIAHPDTGVLTIALAMDQFTVIATDNIGIEIQSISSVYAPGGRLFDTNVLVA